LTFLYPYAKLIKNQSDFNQKGGGYGIMNFTKIVGICLMSSLYACETFIQKKSIKAFERGEKVDVFMILAESAYGFRAVSLTTGHFRFSLNVDDEVAKVI
jgi:hypothetical protein